MSMRIAAGAFGIEVLGPNTAQHFAGLLQHLFDGAHLLPLICHPDHGYAANAVRSAAPPDSRS